MTTVPARAELISTLDEKYVVNTVAFASMVAAGTLIVDAASLRAPDGSLDRERIRRRVEHLSWFAPAMRQRLVHTPLRLTTPAWVPVQSLDLDQHVRFHDRVEPDDPARVEVLTGRTLPRMDMRRPLWDFLFVELDSGRVAIVIRYHHVVGDALYGLRIGDVIAGPHQDDDLPVVGADELFAVGETPRSGVQTLAIAFSSWRAAYGGVAAGLRAYRRKPAVARLRRWGGRILRPLKNRRIEAAGLVERTIGVRVSGYVVVGVAAAMKRAYRLGGTLNDLTVAATLRAMADQRPGLEKISILVPISRRAHDDARTRNHVSVVKVTVPADATLEEMMPLVRAQVQAAVDGGGSITDGVDDQVGYATYVTWGRPPRFFGAAPVETVTGWPAGDPRDEVACLACSYRDDLVISVTARDTVDVPAFLRSVETAMATTVERR